MKRFAVVVLAVLILALPSVVVLADNVYLPGVRGIAYTPTFTATATRPPTATMPPTPTRPPTPTIPYIPPTATATRTVLAPTAASTATPTTLVAPLAILSHYDRQSAGYTIVGGEVGNNTGSAAYFVKIGVTFYNASNTVMGTDFTYTTLNMLLPGERSPFTMYAEPQAGWTRYELAVLDYSSTGVGTYTHLPVLGLNGYSDGSYYHVVGEVTNPTASTQRFVKVACTIRNLSGAVIATDFTYVASTDLAPGAKSSFDCIIDADDVAGMASYAAIAEGSL